MNMIVAYAMDMENRSMIVVFKNVTFEFKNGGKEIPFKFLLFIQLFWFFIGSSYKKIKFFRFLCRILVKGVLCHFSIETDDFDTCKKRRYL